MHEQEDEVEPCPGHLEKVTEFVTLAFAQLFGAVRFPSPLFQFVTINQTLSPKFHKQGQLTKRSASSSSLLLPPPILKSHCFTLPQRACIVVTESDHLLYCCFTLLPSSSECRTIRQGKACFSKSFVPSSLCALHSTVLYTVNVHILNHSGTSINVCPLLCVRLYAYSP